MKSVDPYW